MPERSLKTLFFHFLSNQYFLKKLTAKQFFLKKFVLSLAQLQIRHRIQIITAADTLNVLVIAGHTDHRRIIGTENGGGMIKCYVTFSAFFLKRCPQGRIRSHAAGNGLRLESQGEDLKTILDSYPKLPYADKKELKKELSE